MRTSACFSLCVSLVLLAGLTPAAGASEWRFDWNVRTDQDGKPAGHYEATPCPITETTTSYSINYDEGTKTYELGRKVFVDGGYKGGPSDGSFARPWTTIRQGLKQAPAGNTTLVIRGAHDGFNGEYDEVYLVMKGGVDDTHRFMVVGYGQERPVIKGCSMPPFPEATLKWPYGETLGYTTVQRLKLQDNYGAGIRSAATHSYINCIDLWIYNCCKWDFTAKKAYADGSLYFLASDYCTIRHCTSERPQNHAYKVGDGADYPVVEWSVAKETGWWKDYPIPERDTGHPTAFDFPNDTISNVTRNVKLRYCIADTGLTYGIQLRTRTHGGHDLKFNEITGFPHVNDVPAEKPRSFRSNQALIYTAGETDFHNNLIHDPGDADACGVYVTACTAGPIRIYNNLIYGHEEGVFIWATSAPVLLYNNSIHCDSPKPVIDFGYPPAAVKLTMVNNILYQAGTGPCVLVKGGASEHSHNRYYFPKGTRGVELGAGESDGDPGWLALPAGAYSAEACRLKAALPGLNLSTIFKDDFTGALRAAWDMGAFEYRGE